MKKTFPTLIFTAFVLVSMINANATIVTTADGIYGYEWLEFTHTRHMHRDAVEATLLGSDQPLDGFRYATRLETELLLDSYYTSGTGDLHNDGMDLGLMPETYDAADAFLDDFGYFWDTIYEWNERIAFFYYGSDYELEQLLQPEYTYLGSVYERNSEEYAEFYDEDPIYEGLFKYDWGTDADSAGYWIRKNEFYWNGFDNIDMGMSLLVKSSAAPVPEPTTILLFSAGIIGLIGSRTRRKK